MKRLMTIAGGPLLALIMVLAALGFLPQGAALAVGEPPAGTTNSIQNYTLYSTTKITTAGTTNSSAQHVQFWNAADIFVTADVASGGIVTATVQVSADGTNYTNATYTYVADTLASTTSVVTGTSGLTATTTTSSSSTPTEQTYQVVLSSDGTDYLRVPVAGQYIRVSLATTGTVTPTVKATMRNN